MVTQTIRRSANPVWYKSINQKAVEVNQQSRTVSGMLAAFGNIDEGRDMLIRGCFAKSIAEHGPGSNSDRKIAFLWQHESDDPIGRFTKLEETDEGLYFEAEIDEVPSGDRALKQYASGTLNQHSIGFNYVWDKIEYNNEGDFFLVKEVKLYEGSVVSFGMNENTPFLGFKSLQSGDVWQEVEAFLKSPDTENKTKFRKNIQKILSLSENEPVRPLETVPEPVIEFDKLIKSFTLNF
jgi:HK97 family phage prohead protease